MTDPRVRVSDADRQRVVSDLERHTAAGRLTLDEYAQRVDAALAARTRGDLVAVTADLPSGDGPDSDRPAAEPSDERRHLLWAFLVAALVLVLFAVVLGLAR